MIAHTNVNTLRPGSEPPSRPSRRTRSLTNASKPSRLISVPTRISPALPTNFGSSKTAS